MSEIVFEARDIRRAYGRGRRRTIAVDGVDLALEAGTVTLLSGPSGSGKTTVLHILGGWERPDSGTLLWRGDVIDPGSLGWSDIAFIPQRLGLLPELTANENASLPGRLVTGRWGMAEAAITSLGLGWADSVFPDELSNGEQQRIAVARAIAAKSSVVLADEPSASQDEESARLVFEALRRAAAAGAACVIAGHDPIAVEYVDHHVRMRDGRIVDGADATGSTRSAP
jgi:putative ABC transport system ATP-binding protein